MNDNTSINSVFCVLTIVNPLLPTPIYVKVSVANVKIREFG